MTVAQVLSSRRLPWIIVALAVVLSLPSVGTGLMVDDLVHRAIFLRLPGFTTPRLQMFSWVLGGSDGGAMAPVALPWWAAADLTLAFWRPLTALTHLADYALWPNAPWMMHLHNVAWYAALVAAATILFRRLMGAGWPAGLAAGVYAVSYTHATPVVFIANRNALLGAFFGVVTLLLHQRSRARDDRIARIAAPLTLLLGLLANEGTIAACAYLIAYAVFVDQGAIRRRLSSVAPYVMIVLVWRVVYQLQGFGASASEAYIDPGGAPAKFLAAIATRAPIYLLAEWVFPPSDLFSAAAAVGSGVGLSRIWWQCAVAFGVVLCAVLLPLLRREPLTRFWFAGMVLALVPACATSPEDRMLLLSGLGSAALFARVASAVQAGELAPWPLWQRLSARLVFDLAVVCQLLLSPIGLPIRMYATGRTFGGLTEAIGELASRDDLSNKLVVLVDDVLFMGAYFPALRALSGRAPAERLLVLAPLSDRFDTVVVSRPSSNTLVMQIGADYRWFLERDREHPFRAGDTIDLGRVRVEVRQVRDGRPTVVAFQFDTSLDADSIAWFGRIEPASARFSGRGRHPPWQPPRIGQTITLP